MGNRISTNLTGMRTTTRTWGRDKEGAGGGFSRSFCPSASYLVQILVRVTVRVCVLGPFWGSWVFAWDVGRGEGR